MKHNKCGGKFVRISNENNTTVYQCNKCSKIFTVYVKTATGGSQKEVKK